MSKKSLELLRALSLLNKDNSVPDLATIEVKVLEERLLYFHAQRSKAADDEINDIRARHFASGAMLSSLSARNVVAELGPKLLVHEGLVVDDPLYNFATPLHEQTRTERAVMGMPADEELDLGELHIKLTYYSQLAPLIEAGFLNVMPIGILHDRQGPIPFNVPRNYYRERVPSQAVEFIRQSVIVRPMKRTSEGIIILEEPNVKRVPLICVSFKDDEPGRRANFYQFTNKFAVEGENPDGSLRISWPLMDETPVGERMYAAWEEQSINQTVGARLEAVIKEMRLAELLGASYVTESTFEAELMARSGNPSVDSNDMLAVNFLEANQGLLNVSDPKIVYRLLTENPELFSRFRLSLKAISESLKGIDPSEFSEKARILFEKEVHSVIDEINAVISKIWHAGIKGAIQTAGAIYLGLLTGGTIPYVSSLLFLVATGAAAETIPAVGDYVRSRQRPEFIWKKLKK